MAEIFEIWTSLQYLKRFWE